ncbi:hypothetical protein PR048_001999 [Dryococelus australis]|uniref:Uncharacterized protein n=1 Tax=Dryococelus australis TaxID=614101 RepID=A0ABQ9IIX3_9NEOP|nr:hypothetical protein PR048_001999 [Dryococelus australis]
MHNRGSDEKWLERFQEEAVASKEVVTCSCVRLRNRGLQNNYTTRLGTKDQWGFHCDRCGTKHEHRKSHCLIIWERKYPFFVKCYLKYTYNGRLRVIEFYVAENDSSPIIGLSACVMLDLVKIVVTVQAKTRDSNLSVLIFMYPQCFECIGELPGAYNIMLREDAKQWFILLTRLLLLSGNKLVISLLMIHKYDNSLRICLDRQDLNDALIKLDESSTDYCTFNTPWGRYKFLRLPNGICSAPEVFHPRFSEVFEGLPGVLMHIDNIMYLLGNFERGA